MEGEGEENLGQSSNAIYFVSKAELQQLKLTPIICLMNFVNKQVGNLKN